MRPAAHPQKRSTTAKPPPAPAASRKPASRKPAAKVPAPRPTPPRAGPPEALSLAELARATGLTETLVLDRALAAFARAHGLDRVAVERGSQPPAPPLAPRPAARPEKRAPAQAAPPLAPPVRLYVKCPGRPPQEMIGDTFVVGSSQKCDLWVSSPRIETRHLRIVREGTRYFAEDLRSGAGTVFDGRPLTGRHEIAHEDRLFLAGYHELRFYLLA